MEELDYITLDVAAELWSDKHGRTVSAVTIKRWCQLGRIEGARREVGPRAARWVVPREALLAYEPPPEGRPKGRKRKTDDQ